MHIYTNTYIFERINFEFFILLYAKYIKIPGSMIVIVHLHYFFRSFPIVKIIVFYICS